MLKPSLENVAGKLDVLGKEHHVKKQLALTTEWTGCGSTQHINKTTFEDILMYGRPEDTSDNCTGTFDYSSGYCVSNEFVKNHVCAHGMIAHAPSALPHPPSRTNANAPLVTELMDALAFRPHRRQPTGASGARRGPPPTCFVVHARRRLWAA